MVVGCQSPEEESDGEDGESGSASDTSAGGQPLGPAYCSVVDPPDGIRTGRATRGNGTLQIDLGRWEPIDFPALECGVAFPECNRQWESVVPIPEALPGEYGGFDRIHRLYFAPSTCGGPTPDHSEGLEGTTLVIYETTEDCVTGSLTDMGGQVTEFIAEICDDP